MEVHHHPDLHHKRKKFREYLLEFVMIFLAVTLGFLAESLRENLADHAREKEYIASFVNNLRDDLGNWDSTIADNEEKVRNLRQLVLLSKSDLRDTTARRQFYELSQHMTFYGNFESNDATMMQLKNSGGLRYIRREHVADSIAYYDQCIKGIYAAGDVYNKANDAGVVAMNETLDFTIYYDTTYFKKGHFIAGKLIPLLTDDPKKVHAYFNMVEHEIGWTDNYINNLKKYRPFAGRLLAYLSAEYDL